MKTSAMIVKRLSLLIVAFISLRQIAYSQDITIYDGGEGDRDRERVQKIGEDTAAAVREANETLERIRREQQATKRHELKEEQRRREEESKKELKWNILIVAGVLGVLYMIARKVR